jgi:hypothetical protein
MWQIVRNLTLADAHGYRVLICDPGWQAESGGAGAARGDSRRPNTVSGAQSKRLRRMVRPLDQGGMSEPSNSARRP